MMKYMIRPAARTPSVAPTPMPAAAPADRPSPVEAEFEGIEDVGVGAPISALAVTIFDNVDDVVETDPVTGSVILISPSFQWI